MVYKKFIEKSNADYAKHLINKEELEQIQSDIAMTFGIQLQEYILAYGYLGFEEVEFYGINSKQMENSDLISQTLYLHKYFDKTAKYIAFENLGEGFYILVDSKDCMFSYSSEEDSLVNLNIDLENYILKRFEEKD